ncbi:MAG: DUF2750 domain-containing protein [Pseudomonadota bacterium]
MTRTLEEFASCIKSRGSLWSLKNADDAWAMHEDPEDGTEAMPVWADEASARRCAVGEWAGFEATELDLGNFIRDWLPALDEEAAWVGINFTGDEQGEMVDPLELLELLTA